MKKLMEADRMKNWIALLLALVMVAVCGVCFAEDEEILTEGDFNYTILPDGTVKIHQYDAFNDDTTIKIPAKLGGKQVTELGEWSFSGCFATVIVIPEGVKTIGEGTFSFCDAMESITIPKSVTAIGVSAFEDCTSLTSVTIPGPVELIEDKAFIGCTAVTSVTLGEGVVGIGVSAFEGCESLETVSLPSTLKVIDSAAFAECYALTGMKLPEGIETLETYAFRECSSLETINLPASLSDIGACVFEDCDMVTITLKKGSFAEDVCESYGYNYECED